MFSSLHKRRYNMSKITKAVIPAAGLGVRMLPAAKAVPKEMMSIVDKPAMHYQIKEAVDSGITDILIITNRGKGAIEDYFDYSPEYEKKLLASGKEDVLREINEIAEMANITYLRQKAPKGLGHAVWCAKSFVGNEPFAVLYGDDVIESETPTTKSLIDLYEKYNKLTVGVREVTREQIVKYSSLDATEVDKDIYVCRDMIEKPTPDKILSCLSILGRVVLPPEIFAVLENQAPGAGGEIQLTDAMATFARADGIMAYKFPGIHHDMGSKLGLLKANISYGVKHSEIGEEFTEWLKEYVKTL